MQSVKLTVCVYVCVYVSWKCTEREYADVYTGDSVFTYNSSLCDMYRILPVTHSCYCKERQPKKGMLVYMVDAHE